MVEAAFGSGCAVRAVLSDVYETETTRWAERAMNVVLELLTSDEKNQVVRSGIDWTWEYDKMSTSERSAWCARAKNALTRFN